MQKKLIALAVAGVFAAPAFAATSNVDIFGKMQVEVSSANNGSPNDGIYSATSSQRDMNVDSSQNTEFGVKGSEDLGGGLSATWQIATDITIDGSGGNFTPRNTFVGLKSKSLGEVRIGKHDTPYKMSTGRLDLFTGTIADYNTLMGTSGYTLGSAVGRGTVAIGTTGTTMAGASVFNFTGTSTSNPQFDARPNNTVLYLSPEWTGFSFAASVSATNEDAVDSQDGPGPGTARESKNGQAYSASASYNNGPFYVTAAYERQRASKSNFGSPDGNDGYGAKNDPADQKAWKIGTGLTFGTLKVNAIWEKLDDNGEGSSACDVSVAYTGNAIGVQQDTCSHARTAWYLGASYGIGAMTLKAAYTRMGEMDGWDDSGAKQWTLGVDYAMSKRTTLYALYTRLNNDDGAAYSLGQGGTSSPTNVLLNSRGNANGICGNNGVTGGANIQDCDINGGADPSAFAVGIVHTF